MMKFVAIACLVAVAAAVPVYKVGSQQFLDEEEALFVRFKGEHGKVYYDEKDETYRKTVFVQNLRTIREHNAGDSTFTMAMNEFGDLTWEEFHAKYTGVRGANQNSFLRSKNIADLSHVETADSIDWTSQGAVTPVKNQGQCGSCWAFSSTGAIEGITYIKKGTLTSLSEQNLMDCSKGEGNNSCEGGLMDYAFEYVIKKGICSEASYPYQMRDESCQSSCSSAASISGYKDVAQSESALAAAVTQQPVSIAIEADQSAFQFYSSGVFTAECGTQLDHGVLAVGYGTLGGTKYWKVKNSWGATWGSNGYILLEKGKNSSGQCGILLSASYPEV